MQTDDGRRTVDCCAPEIRTDPRALDRAGPQMSHMKPAEGGSRYDYLPTQNAERERWGGWVGHSLQLGYESTAHWHTEKPSMTAAGMPLSAVMHASYTQSHAVMSWLFWFPRRVRIPDLE